MDRLKNLYILCDRQNDNIKPISNQIDSLLLEIINIEESSKKDEIYYLEKRKELCNLKKEEDKKQLCLNKIREKIQALQIKTNDLY